MSGVFRDPTQGTRARVDDLLGRRRAELVTLPHIVRRVVVARSARIVASIAICIAGAAMLAAAACPDLANWIADAMPGQRPAPLSTLLIVTWVVGIAAYAIARSVSEHRFQVRMSAYVLPGDDLNQDLERLSHEHPDHVAKHMAHSLEVKSAALPILAASVLLPVSLIYLLSGLRNLGWPAPNDFEAAIAIHSGALIASAIAGLVGAVVITRRSARVSRVAPIAAGFAALAAAMTLASFYEWREYTWMIFIPGFIAAMVALTVRRLRIERVKIAADDPAAGSEIFTIRGLFRSIRSGLAKVNATLTLHNAKRLAIGVKNRPKTVVFLAVAGFGLWSLFGLHGNDVQPMKPQIVTGQGIDMKSAPTEDTTWQVTKSTGGRYDVAITLGDLYEIEIPTLAGVEEIPAGWELVVTVRAQDEDLGLDMAVVVSPALDAIVEPRELNDEVSSLEFVIDNCENMSIPLGLRIRPRGNAWEAGDTISLSVEPRLRVASCRGDDSIID